MTGPQAAKLAREQLAELIGHSIDSISGLARTSEGWQITFELVELERIPSSSDLLATYETTLSDEGLLVRYQRTRRYQRSQIMEAS